MGLWKYFASRSSGKSLSLRGESPSFSCTKIPEILIHLFPALVRFCCFQMEWFARYNKNLGSYMRSLGDGVGLDLTVDIRPPKNIYVEVRTSLRIIIITCNCQLSMFLFSVLFYLFIY